MIKLKVWFINKCQRLELLKFVRESPLERDLEESESKLNQNFWRKRNQPVLGYLISNPESFIHQSANIAESICSFQVALDLK